MIALLISFFLVFSGSVRPRHYNWIEEASKNVPIPSGTYKLYSGYDPEYFPKYKEIYLPQPGKGGWTYHDEHYLLLHELGHVFDFTRMNNAERFQFRRAIKSPCTWWSTRCWSPRFHPRYSVPPGEDFAETYAACALGITREQADDQEYPSYGFTPPVDDKSLCRLIWNYA